MLARDQSRIPPGRSIRLTSSGENGACFARHAQKSRASLSNASICADALALKPQRTATQMTPLTHQQCLLIAAMIAFRYPVCHLKSILVCNLGRDSAEISFRFPVALRHLIGVAIRCICSRNVNRARQRLATLLLFCAEIDAPNLHLPFAAESYRLWAKITRW